MSEEQTPVVEEPTNTPEGGLDNLLSGSEQVNTPEGEEQTPVDGERPEWLPEKFKSPEAMAEAYKNLESKFGGFSGAPEDYEVTVPEGVDFQFYEGSDFGVDKFKEFAKESNMSQETFSKAMDFYVQSRVYDAMVEQKSREDSVYEVFGGKEAATKEIPQISARVKGALGEDGMKVYQDAASGSHTAAASAIKLAGMLINKLDGEHTQAHVATPTPEVSRDELREMMKDPRYKTSQEFRDKVDAGYRKLFG